MKVAVIGAGFSGMLTSYLLEKEGIDVTVYEKNENVGGHCRTLISKDMYIDLGANFTLGHEIKELFLELDLDYSEKFTYRNFVGENYQNVQHIPADQVSNLLRELVQLKKLLKTYALSLDSDTYGYIHEDLLKPLDQFLKDNDLNTVCQVVAPHLSSFGYGDISETQAFYALSVFNDELINSLIKGDKFIFSDKGMFDLIKKLSHNITDIRYSIEVKNIEVENEKVKVETDYDSALYDKVFITTKLPRDVIKDELYNHLMKKIDTNPYVTCAFEVDTQNLVTTYFKANFGKKNRIQFFHPTKKNGRTVIVTFAYGNVSSKLIENITEDIKKYGITIKHLIATKQWYIFPHLNKDNLTQDYYSKLHERQKNNPINLIGSLVCEPSLSKLYTSIKHALKEMI